MSATPTPSVATNPYEADRRKQDFGSTIAGFLTSLAVHAVILLVLAAITWVVVRPSSRDVVLEFGGGGSHKVGSRKGLIQLAIYLKQPSVEYL